MIAVVLTLALAAVAVFLLVNAVPLLALAVKDPARHALSSEIRWEPLLLAVGLLLVAVIWL